MEDYGIARLVEVVSRLRAPGGCPWDQKQTHSSLARFAIEESYELVEAIQSQDRRNLMDELGDVLLQVLLHAEIASENKDFSLKDVLENLEQKLIRRHP